jgi:hypothetical protein
MCELFLAMSFQPLVFPGLGQQHRYSRLTISLKSQSPTIVDLLETMATNIETPAALLQSSSTSPGSTPDEKGNDAFQVISQKVSMSTNTIPLEIDEVSTNNRPGRQTLARIFTNGCAEELLTWIVAAVSMAAVIIILINTTVTVESGFLLNQTWPLVGDNAAFWIAATYSSSLQFNSLVFDWISFRIWDSRYLELNYCPNLQ